MRIALASLLAGSFVLAACSGEHAVTEPELSPSLALASANNTVGVTESDIVRQIHNSTPTNDWVFYTRDGGAGLFRSGPGSPPSGVGSFELSTTTSNDKAYLFNYDHKGTALSTISAIEYSTYRRVGSLQQVAALNLEVDFNGPAVDGGFTTLVFEPVYNTVQGEVLNGVWQTWDAFNGGNARWWSTKDIPGACSFNCFVSWADILAANRQAVILGAFGVNQGGGNPGLTSAVDKLTLGYGGNTITYNFEPYRVATTANQCKNGGWMTLKRADGSSFKNQGDCVSYTKNGK
jgi:hypothetical protein